MSLTVLWIISIVSTIVIIVSTSLPNSTVEWLISKFEIHSKLSDEDVTITTNGKCLEGKAKIQFINYFNDATFLRRYNIYQGTEELYLYPKNSGTPFVIDTKRGKKDVRLFVYRYDDHVDVVKQYKKKIAAYSLRSNSLQKCPMSVSGDLSLKEY